MQDSHEKMCGGIIFSSLEKNIYIKPLKLNAKFFLVAIWKKGEMATILASWSKDLI